MTWWEWGLLIYLGGMLFGAVLLTVAHSMGTYDRPRSSIGVWTGEFLALLVWPLWLSHGFRRAWKKREK